MTDTRAAAPDQQETNRPIKPLSPYRGAMPERPVQSRSEAMRPRGLLRFARLTYEYFVFYLGYFYFGVGCAFVSTVCALLHPLIPDRVGSRFGRWATGLHFRGFLALLKASGLVHLDLAALDGLRDEQSLILAPNHPSLLDAVLVISRLPQTACAMIPRPRRPIQRRPIAARRTSIALVRPRRASHAPALGVSLRSAVPPRRRRPRRGAGGD
ncbi:MAG: hypothetical protein ABI619_14305, partial [Betaproteobacteria bacterium]